MFSDLTILNKVKLEIYYLHSKNYYFDYLCLVRERREHKNKTEETAENIKESNNI